ncbi:hypothetical protein N7495_007234 [Penicillium taxi]|uniref:uncharacterized protein n=1 Tax=Penicillium taxi TaxID=168475 RepID=UPI00254513F0|nr:uncharacterized protein N7495_007234 [Penicillium taxi]KAJ5895543.1 hypothetical protein N7495_007234 [Penicillium taxi]
MSPAPITEDTQPDLHSDQLQAVGKAFDALLLTLYQLTNRHNELKHHAEDIFKEFTNVTRQLAPHDRPHAMDIQQRLLDEQKELCLGVQSKPRIEEQSLNSMDVIKTLVSHQNVDENAIQAIMAGIKGYKAMLRSQDDPSRTSNSCILAYGPDLSKSLERDFTTNGTQGSLHCPFSQNEMNGKSDGPKIQIDSCGQAEMDPIKAELEERRLSTAPSAPSAPSIRSSQCPVSRCPIRFLDKHSPEEIASYVERHKHEIPRSHAICVKRYQRDPQNMRQLDAKYGGLINMISGLSAKHQIFLPNQPTNGYDGDGASSRAPTERVEKWAETVDPTTASIHDENKDEREGRFERPDRPLREVRLGESPSRPWGIPVPITQEANSVPVHASASTLLSPTAHENSHEKSPEIPTKPVDGCPFGHGAPNMTDPKPEVQPDPEPVLDAPKLESPWANWGNSNTAGTAPKTEEPSKPNTNSIPANVIFNGPVFFGYPSEQVATLLQQLGQLSKH